MSPAAGELSAAHLPSHDALLRPADDAGPDRAPDAVVVSATRSADHLRPAIELAAELDAVLVVLCSGGTDPAEVIRLADAFPALCRLVVDLPADYRLWQMTFRTERDFRAARTGQLGDLSLKRNIGLLLGRLAGWRSLLFLDDDIRGLDADTVRAATAALVPGGAVGMPARSYPDNSVVCHAHRFVGGRQGVFVSGSALVVDVEQVTSFFPAVYNEDWLFLADGLAAGTVSAVGETSQLPYDPFERAGRARSEEFGDVLAEGLVALLHAGRSFAEADESYWIEFLQRRRDFVREIRARSRAADLDRVRARRVRRSLWAADIRRRQIGAALLADYVVAWRQDVERWRQLMSVPSRCASLTVALDILGLRSATRLGGVAVRPPAAPVHPPTELEAPVRRRELAGALQAHPMPALV